MPQPKSDPKADALREQGCLHPHPEKAAREFDLAFPRCGVMGRAARGGGGQR
ncbi:MAG: hypothetical protein HY744_27625 [Deltaproteobacteria bacterium]|nr:hypothetical protein [Deltaproteobacteria bacterium]